MFASGVSGWLLTGGVIDVSEITMLISYIIALQLIVFFDKQSFLS
jgi:hypothetical protein